MSLMKRFSQRGRQLPAWPASESLGPFAEELDDWFDEFFRRTQRLAPRLGFEPRWFAPRIDVYESEEAIEVTAELPGIDPEEVDVTLTADSLTIAGEKRQEEEEKRQDYYRSERRYGAFRRVIPLPSGQVDEDNVTSFFKQGVLTVTLPKLPEAVSHTRHIPVKAA